ncbi:MAG: CPBP family intramembrane metalloprotease, partial [Candidatus Bathyarchaeota archaeon]
MKKPSARTFFYWIELRYWLVVEILAVGRALRAFLTYFIVVLIVFLSAYGFPRESALSEIVPVLLSVALLVPIYIWHRNYAEEEKLSNEISGRAKSSVVFWVFVLFMLALAVRIPSVLLFGMPYEKTPLIYLVILTIVVIERTDVSVFGFKSEKIGFSLLRGATLYLVLGGSTLFIEYLLVYAFTGQSIVGSFSLGYFLLAMPFQTLCVGISEEGFFRGYIQTHLERISTFRKAILAQALLFGVW